MGTSVKRSTSLKQIIDRAEGYDIPGEIVDGMNFREVRDKLSEIVTSIRKDPHPAFVEIRTYRYRGHSMSDPAKYRTREEVEKIRTDQDPIEQVRNRLLAAKVSEQELKAIDAEVREIVNASADFAQRDPEPDPSELWTDIYR
jgi:pyruvate dehydrogenase E1 component alpha subunit